MMKFEYKYFYCSGTDLEAKLNEFGADGWRLHTCDPAYVRSPYGDITDGFHVVMDRAYQERVESSSDEIDRSEAIACKG